MRIYIRIYINKYTYICVVYTCMSVYTRYVCIYVVCLYSRCTSVYTLYVCIYVVCLYSHSLTCMSVYTLYVCINVVCLYIRGMCVYTLYVCIYVVCLYSHSLSCMSASVYIRIYTLMRYRYLYVFLLGGGQRYVYIHLSDTGIYMYFCWGGTVLYSLN